MAQYYYLVSSLPVLVYDQTPNMTLVAFGRLCQEHLHKQDYELIRKSRLNDFENTAENNTVLTDWYHWEINLRNELVKLRAQKQNRDAAKYLKPVPYIFGTGAIANEAFNQPLPLATEDVLDLARWQHLTNLETAHYFDIEKLIIYSLKLQLLEKKKGRTANLGKEFFDQMINTKLSAMKAGEQT